MTQRRAGRMSQPSSTLWAKRGEAASRFCSYCHNGWDKTAFPLPLSIFFFFFFPLIINIFFFLTCLLYLCIFFLVLFHSFLSLVEREEKPFSPV